MSSHSFSEKDEFKMYNITYSDLMQTGTFIVALIGLCYTIFNGKKKMSRPLLAIVNGI